MSGTYSGSDKRLAYLFENGGGGGGGSSTLAGLDDVNLSSPTDGQVLKYDATNEEWINGAGGSGGGELYLNTIYSETEEKVGYWTDGKPLYQKTLVYNQSYIYATSNWGEIPFSNVPANIERVRIFDVEQLDPSGDVYFDNRVRYFYSNSKVYGISTQSQHTVAGLIITIQYTKTTDTPEIPQRGNVIYLPTIYSEEEREVGVWTDGKPLYQKTWRVNNVSISMTSWTDLNAYIPNIGFETFVKCECIDENGTYQGPVLGGINASGHVQMLSPRNGSSSIDAIVAITIQYTKTTDTAGSGSWTPSGAPAVHYSTEEQVVGTWIDGSTLYEKSIVTTITNGTQWVDTGIDSACNITHVEGVLNETGGNSVCIPSSDPQEQIGFNVSAVGVVTSDKWSVLFRTTNTNARGGLVATFQYTKSS